MSAQRESTDSRRDGSSTTAAEIQRLFAHGQVRDAADGLGRALDAGMPWEIASGAVTEGIAQRYGPPVPGSPAVEPSRPSRSSTVAALLVGLIVYVALRPVFGFGHEIVAAALANSLHAVAVSSLSSSIISLLPLDPVYLTAAIHAVGGVQAEGFAVTGGIGEWLHQVAPRVFLSPDLVREGAGVSMIPAPGATVIGRSLVVFGTAFTWLAVGLALVMLGRKTGRAWLVPLGLCIQAQVAINHLLSFEIDLQDLEASGLPFAVAVASEGGRDEWFTERLTNVPAPVLQALFGVLALCLAYVCLLGAVRGARRLKRVDHGLARGESHSARPTLGLQGSVSRPTLAGVVAAVAVAISPIGVMALGESNWDLNESTTASSVATPEGQSAFRRLSRSGPCVVRFRQLESGSWQYVVDGAPEVIRGMGYNPRYAKRPQDERTRLYDRDFQTMSTDVGVNTIEGWFDEEFDEVTLDSAARHGLGVIMPFELNQDRDYADPAVQAQILDRVSEWVLRYRDHPAVRMWAPGNENLHRILYPNWVSQENVPAARARADAFAAFLPVLVDRIHELDPNHPVLYRDAEDRYLRRLKAAFERTGVVRPWLLYGSNVYVLSRLDEVLAQWSRKGIGGPLVISEFAPAGVAPSDRPAVFQKFWRHIRARKDIVLGGFAYAWATNGPEELDRIFGLIDTDGARRDGTLDALREAFLAE